MKSFRSIPSLLLITAFVALTACSGGGGGGGGPTITPPSNNPGGGGSTPTPAPNTTITSPALGVNSSATVTAAENVDNGSESWYTGGVTAWSSSAGSTASGANGSNTVDGVSCTQMGEPAGTTQLHVHAFVGLYVNGTEQAIPAALGMKAPTEPKASGLPNDNYAVLTAQCFYHIHTHDYSGVIHIEDSSLPQSFLQSSMPSYATLKTLFDIWGQPVTPSTVATFTGSVAVYIGTPAPGSQLVSSYTPYNGSLNSITLGHHVAVWIVVGTPPPAGLPQVLWKIED